MKKIILKSLIAPLVVLALAVPAFSVGDPDTKMTMADCETATAASKARQATLENAAVKVERVTDEQGKPADRYYLPMVAKQGSRPGTIRFELALYHQDVLAFAKSPEWYNSANGRYYWYQAQTWVDHQISDPCSGPDLYKYGFNAGCWRRLGIDEVRNYCTWATYVGLQTSATGGEGSFGAPWGYKKVYKNGTPVQVCGSSGGSHSITDGIAIRTYLEVDVSFYSDSFQLLHLATGRKTVSRGMFGGDHSFYSFVATGKFLDAGAPPPWNTSEIC